MLIPIRCFTCGKVLADLFDQFVTMLAELEKNPPAAAEEEEKDKDKKKDVLCMTEEGQVLDQLGITRYCCRRIMISNVDLMSKILNYDPEQRMALLAEMDKKEEARKSDAEAAEAKKKKRDAMSVEEKLRELELKEEKEKGKGKEKSKR